MGQKNYSDLAEAKKGMLVPKLESTGYLSGFVLANPIKRAGLLHGRFRCIGPLYERTFLVADIELDENMSKPHLEIFKKYQTLFFFWHTVIPGGKNKCFQSVSQNNVCMYPETGMVQETPFCSSSN